MADGNLGDSIQDEGRNQDILRAPAQVGQGQDGDGNHSSDDVDKRVEVNVAEILNVGPFQIEQDDQPDRQTDQQESESSHSMPSSR